MSSFISGDRLIDPISGARISCGYDCRRKPLPPIHFIPVHFDRILNVVLASVLCKKRGSSKTPSIFVFASPTYFFSEADNRSTMVLIWVTESANIENITMFA